MCITAHYKTFGYCMNKVGAKSVVLDKVKEEKLKLAGGYAGLQASIEAEKRAADKVSSAFHVSDNDKAACVEAFRRDVGLDKLPPRPVRVDVPPEQAACTPDLRSCFIHEKTAHGQYQVVEVSVPEVAAYTHVVVSGGCRLASNTSSGHNAFILESFPLANGWHCKNGDQANIATAGEVTAIIKYCKCSV